MLGRHCRKHYGAFCLSVSGLICEYSIYAKVCLPYPSSNRYASEMLALDRVYPNGLCSTHRITNQDYTEL